MAGLLELRQMLCDKIERTYDKSIDPNTQLCVTAGATQAIFTAITAFVHKGDEVIIIEPAYDCYKPAVQICGGIVVPYAMTFPDYAIDWNQIDQLVNDSTRMIIINTPHNPTGTLLLKEDLEALETIVQGKDIVVLSDEVYEHLIYDGEAHQSVMRFSNLFNQSLAVFSFGKTLHTTGWKMGYVVGPDHLVAAFKNIHQWNVFCVNSFLQHAIAEYLRDPTTYTYLPGFLEEKRDYMNQLFNEVPLTPLISKGTYFQLYSYDQVSKENDVDFSKYLTKDVGVAAIPLSPFYTTPTGDKVIRLCFAKTNETLDAAADRLKNLL